MNELAPIRLGVASVLRGTLVLPRVGLWHASMDIDAPLPPIGVPTTLTVGLSTFSGTCIAGGPWAGISRVLFVPGAGLLQSGTVPAAYYRACAATLPLSTMLSGLGERLAASASIPGSVDRYTVPTGPAMTAVTAYLTAILPPGYVWRALDSGEIWAGVEAWAPTVTTDDQANDSDDLPEIGLVTTAMREPLVRPGTVWRARYVERVELDLHAETQYAAVYYRRSP